MIGTNWPSFPQAGIEVTDNPTDSNPEQVVLIKINGQTASKRTRNRVREAGPQFFLVKKDYFDRFNTECALVRSPKGFFGWLPLNEIIISATKE